MACKPVEIITNKFSFFLPENWRHLFRKDSAHTVECTLTLIILMYLHKKYIFNIYIILIEHFWNYNNGGSLSRFHYTVESIIISNSIEADFIIADSIIADYIIADSIIADSIIADSIIEDSIKADSIIADSIEADSII